MTSATLNRLRRFNKWQPRIELDYIGKSVMLDRRARSIVFAKQNHIEPGKPRVPITWNMDDQAWAVQQGFFFGRCEERNQRVTIMPLRETLPGFATRVLAEIEHKVFEIGDRTERLSFYDRTTKALEQDLQWIRALEFVEQQDRFGYIGAWEDQIACYTFDLRWFRLHYRNRAETIIGFVSKARLREMEGLRKEDFAEVKRPDQISDIYHAIYPDIDEAHAIAEAKQAMPRFAKSQTDLYNPKTGEVLREKGARHNVGYTEPSAFTKSTALPAGPLNTPRKYTGKSGKQYTEAEVLALNYFQSEAEGFNDDGPE